MKAMILAAGLGTRLKPFTDHHPKALAPVNGKSVLQRNVEYLQRHGIKDVIVNVHHFADQIEKAIVDANGWGSNITISDERDEVLETGGGIVKAAWFLNDHEDFVVMNADILTDLDLTGMIAAHREHGSLATLAVTNRKSSRSLLFDKENEMCGWRNEKTGELKGKKGKPKAFSGIQVFSPNIFKHFRFTGKFSMIDVYLDLCYKYMITAFDHSDGHFIDIGTPEKLAAAEKVFP
jgi:NDP-sugar pyrophosphorylase family protein